MGKKTDKRSVISSDSEWDNSDSEIDTKIITKATAKELSGAKVNKKQDKRQFASDSDLDLDSDGEAKSNIVERTKINKKLLNSGRKTALEFSDSEDEDLNKLMVNKEYEAKFTEKKEKSVLNQGKSDICSSREPYSAQRSTSHVYDPSAIPL